MKLQKSQQNIPHNLEQCEIQIPNKSESNERRKKSRIEQLIKYTQFPMLKTQDRKLLQDEARVMSDPNVRKM